MKTVTVKKLYRNHASIRDYIVEKAILRNESIKVKYKENTMIIPVSRLMNRFQLSQQSFKSKHKEGITYKLYDFLFKKNKDLT